MNRMTGWGAAIGVAGIGLAALAPGASAAPRTTVAASGLQVSWPTIAAETAVAPGSTHRISVRRTGAASRSSRVRVTVTRRLSGNGPAKVIVRRVVRRGSVKLRVSRRAATTYRVVVRIGSRSWQHGFQVAKPTDVGPATPPPPTTAPLGPPQGPRPCSAQDAPIAELQLPAQAVVGSNLAGTVVNRSPGTVTFGRATGWDRQDGDSWTPVTPAPGLAYTSDAILVRPGGTGALGFQVWSTLTAGVYRATLSVTCFVGADLPSASRAATPRSAVPGSFVAVSNPVTVTAE